MKRRALSEGPAVPNTLTDGTAPTPLVLVGDDAKRQQAGPIATCTFFRRAAGIASAL
jgi:hypothetical protein